MRHLRDENLSPDVPLPDPPDIHDVVRVYAHPDSEYYILGSVIAFDDSDDKQIYTVQFVNKAGYTEQTTAYYDRVELETPYQEVERRKELHHTKHNPLLEDNTIQPG